MFLVFVQLATILSAVHHQSEASPIPNNPQNLEVNPHLYHMRITTSVKNRFVHTILEAKFQNVGNNTEEVAFNYALPETAFISGFIMNLDGKVFTSHVDKRSKLKKAKKTEIVKEAQVARDANKFYISIDIEPQSKITFYLSYEEILKRRNGHYEIITNLFPRQLVKDFSVEIQIFENRKITYLKVPELRSGKSMSSTFQNVDPKPFIGNKNNTYSVVIFKPDVERQIELAKNMGTPENNGIAAQFVVDYDVERLPDGGEILIRDGYFVHFFAPSNLAPIPKYVVFVLDTSGSMSGSKLQQMKQAMKTILHELKPDDYFSLVQFEMNVKAWDIHTSSLSAYYPSRTNWYGDSEPQTDLETVGFPASYLATEENVDKASRIVNKFSANGGTNIFSALKVALYLVGKTKVDLGTKAPQPLVMFLTDGEPANGVTNHDEIIEKISQYNSGDRRSPIFAIGFGDDADRQFLENLALRNTGSFKNIYEASDASLQLEGFYNEISSPLLSNVTFKYKNSSGILSKTEFSSLFGGSEIVITGKCDDDTCADESIVSGIGAQGTMDFKPLVDKPISGLQRLWAYTTVEELLEKKQASTNVSHKLELDKEVEKLALKYSFVTSVSPLVVESPDGVDVVYFIDQTSDVGLELLLEAEDDSVTTTFTPPAYTPLVFVPEIQEEGLGGNVTADNSGETADRRSLLFIIGYYILQLFIAMNAINNLF